MILEILTHPAPELSRPAADVDIYSLGPAFVAKLVFDMFQTLRASGGVGLAAPQVGVSLRVIVMDNGLPLAMINPVILEHEAVEDHEEGCLSLPGLRETVRRARRVKVSYCDPQMNPMTADLEGFDAAIVQHEIDHLDGLTLLDRVADSRKRKARREYARINGRKAT